MPVVALVVLGMLAPSEFLLPYLTAPLDLLCEAHGYTIAVHFSEWDGEGRGSGLGAYCTAFPSLLERSTLGSRRRKRSVKVTPDGEIEIRRTVLFHATRLPFGLFLAQLQIDGCIKGPGENPPSTLRLRASRIVPVGRTVRVDLGKDRITGDKRTWSISIDE